MIRNSHSSYFLQMKNFGINCTLSLLILLSLSQITTVNICFLLLNPLLRNNIYYLTSFATKERGDIYVQNLLCKFPVYLKDHLSENT